MVKFVYSLSSLYLIQLFISMRLTDAYFILWYKIQPFVYFIQIIPTSVHPVGKSFRWHAPINRIVSEAVLFWGRRGISILPGTIGYFRLTLSIFCPGSRISQFSKVLVPFIEERHRDQDLGSRCARCSSAHSADRTGNRCLPSNPCTPTCLPIVLHVTTHIDVKLNHEFILTSPALICTM